MSTVGKVKFATRVFHHDTSTTGNPNKQKKTTDNTHASFRGVDLIQSNKIGMEEEFL